MNRQNRLDQDGLDLIEWYERMPGQGTWFVDARIAVEMDWWVGGSPPVFDYRTTKHNPTQSQINKYGDKARVRRTRNHVDRDDGLFAGYHFGTKPNGSGAEWSHLNTPDNSQYADTATDQAASTQFRRVRQHEAQSEAEKVRMVGELETLQERYTNDGKIDHAFVCHDAIRDLHDFGELRPETIRKATELGLLGGGFK